MLKDEMMELISDNTFPCVTITIPLIKISSEHEQDRTKLKNAIFKAGKELLGKNGKTETKKLINELRTIPEKVDFTNNSEGIGIYLSKNINKIVNFPVPVKENVIVGNEFRIRELAFSISETIEYYLLVMSKKGASLYKGIGDTLTEISDGKFPLVYTEIFEYVRPHVKQGPGFSARGVTVDKSGTEDKRRTAHMIKIDNTLHPYITDKTNLVIAGVEQNLGFFKENTMHKKNIIFSIPGNFDLYNITELNRQLKPELKKFINGEKEKLILKLNEMNERDKIVSGINEVWKAAMRGTGSTLIVENDFTISGWTPGDRSEFLEDNSGTGLNLLKVDDAINDVIEAVIKFRGKVVFVNNGSLQNYRRIALLLRYSANIEQQ